MYEEILQRMPYQPGFRFIDGIHYLNDAGVSGWYTLKKDEFFYASHFPGYPVTPGVILTEIMAQIGLVTMGIHLMPQHIATGGQRQPVLLPLMVSADTQFLKIVLPEETVTVESKKIYFRLGKLKCEVSMTDSQGATVARGVLSGMFTAKAV